MESFKIQNECSLTGIAEITLLFPGGLDCFGRPCERSLLQQSMYLLIHSRQQMPLPWGLGVIVLRTAADVSVWDCGFDSLFCPE